MVTLKTGPDSPLTHWKQTIALLPEALNAFIQTQLLADETTNQGSLALNEKDKFECYVIMNQCEENKRCYEIDIGINLSRVDEDLQNSINQEINYEGIDHVEDDEEEDEEDDEYDDEKEHPRPCDCGQIKCLIIKTALERYSQQALELNK